MVRPKDKIQVEKIAGKANEKVVFDKVLLRAEGEKVEVGKPYVAGGKVEGKILRQSRARKVLIMKYKSKTRYRRKRGHRQPFTEVEITKV